MVRMEALFFSSNRKSQSYLIGEEEYQKDIKQFKFNSALDA